MGTSLLGADMGGDYIDEIDLAVDDIDFGQLDEAFTCETRREPLAHVEFEMRYPGILERWRGLRERLHYALTHPGSTLQHGSSSNKRGNGRRGRSKDGGKHGLPKAGRRNRRSGNGMARLGWLG